MKICSKCEQTKDELEFFVRDSSSGRLHSQCKSCYKEQRRATYRAHYQKYKDTYLSRAKIRRTAIRKSLQNEMLLFLRDKKCFICEESDPVVLEFDHLKPTEKSFGIANGIRNGYKWERIQKEIQKCRILCANCHKRHTAIQSGWYKNKLGGTYGSRTHL